MTTETLPFLPRRTPWAVAIREATNRAAHGSYQGDLLGGGETWSGSTLKGAAGKYGARYAESRRNFVDRISALLPGDWTAETAIVRCGPKASRATRELVFISPAGKRWVW